MKFSHFDEDGFGPRSDEPDFEASWTILAAVAAMIIGAGIILIATLAYGG